MAEVGTNPVSFGFAGGYESLCAAEAEALDWADKRLLPAMIGASDWVVAALWHPMNISTP